MAARHFVILRRRRGNRKSQRPGQRAMSLDIAVAQKAGEMSRADVRLVSRERIKKQRHRQKPDRQAHARTLKS
jgi:hypothetical protein